MEHIVLYANNCGACSKVARMVREISVPGLMARALDDSRVLELLSDAGLQVPSRPALLIIGGADAQVVTGWAMRMRLARVVGWRRSVAIVRLLAAEWRARLARSLAPGSPSRRGVIGSLVAGVVGGILASDAMTVPRGRGPGDLAMMIADPEEVTSLPGTASAQQAVRTWGPVEREVLKVTGGGQPVLVMTHPQGTLTFVDNSAGALRSSHPVALSIGLSRTGASETTMRYYSVHGVPLADVAEVNGRITVTSARRSAGVTEPEVTIPLAKLACFVACLESQVDGSCADNCVNCGHHPPWLAAWPALPVLARKG